MTRSDKRGERSVRRALRREIAARRDPAADAAAIAEAGVDLVRALGLDEGDTVTLYESFAGEPPTESLVAALVARGLRVVVPITEPDLDLDWCDVADPERAALGRAAIGEAALVLAPGLSVDREGTRLGQGGGCYDRALPRRAHGAPVVVLLHPGEVADDPLPRDAHDAPVDAVLSVEGVRWLRPRSGGADAVGMPRP